MPAPAGLSFKQAVEQLITSATAAVMLQALPPQRRQGGAPLQAAGLFGTQPGSSVGGVAGPHARGGEGAASSDDGGSSGDEEGSGSEGESDLRFGGGGGGMARSAQGAAAATVTQLMGLFRGSPLFRGGPVPGVQLLHRR